MLPPKQHKINMRIFLIGFMGSGKSHVGKKLAQAIGFLFIDLDDWIEAREQRTIRQLFDAEGEAAFRQMERRALLDMAQFPSVVVACGGGTPCFFNNIEWMNDNGVTIYLQVSTDILFQRLQVDKTDRPLLRGMNEEKLRRFMEQKLAEREPFYRQASVIYEVKEATEDVATALRQHFSNIIGH